MNEENEVSFDDTKTAKKIFYLGDTQSINGLNFMVYDLDFEWHNNDNTGELIRLAKVSMVIVNVGSDSKRLAQADLRIYVGDSGIEYEQHEVSDFTGRTIMPYETVEYFWSALLGAQRAHLRPVGKPPPPLPRRPESETTLITSSGVISVRTLPRAA